MFRSRMTPALAYDEWTLYVTHPDLDAHRYWASLTVRTVIGLLLFVLPGILILAMGLASALANRGTLLERYGSAECVVTSRRVIVAEWGQPRRLQEFEHRQIAGMTSAGWTAKLLVGPSATIHGADGRRVKLDRLPDTDEFIEVSREALAASRY
ncbi:MAG: hypothetical protein F4W95_04185 [Chloroflexi bacterium]|nr:hypothetical protein [Chloroflexota bacterium]MYD47670.1 hypothetical protein [Chloroflexota bacterium]